jgi:glycosyltransferase involved in cell wall biosynthesis
LIHQTLTSYRLPGVIHAIGSLGGRRDAAVVTMHDMRPFHRRVIPWGLQRSVLRRSCLRAKVVTTYNDTMRKELIEALGRRMAERVVPLPLPHGPGRPDYRLEPKFDLLWVGRAERRKHLPAFLAALRQLPLSVSAAVLWSPVGPSADGDPEDIERLLRQEIGRGRALTAMRSGISPVALDELYRQARVCVSTSSYEGFHAPPMEAYLRGTRLVLPRLEVYTEIYEGACGVHWYDRPDSLPSVISEALQSGGFVPSDRVVRSVAFETIGRKLTAIYESAQSR